MYHHTESHTDRQTDRQGDTDWWGEIFNPVCFKWETVLQVSDWLLKCSLGESRGKTSRKAINKEFNSL